MINSSIIVFNIHFPFSLLMKKGGVIMRSFDETLETLHEILMISRKVPSQVKWNFIRDYYHSNLSNNELIAHYSRYI